MFGARKSQDKDQCNNKMPSCRSDGLPISNIMVPQRNLLKHVFQKKEELLESTNLKDSGSNGMEQQYSEVSFENSLMDQHLACIKDSILKINDLVLEASILTSLPVWEFDWQQQESNLDDYFKAGKSLVPPEQLKMLTDYLVKDDYLLQAVEWIHGYAPDHLGDELILATHRILLAYLPIRHLSLSDKEIHQISQFWPNTLNIFADSSFSILRIGLNQYLQVFPVKLGAGLISYLQSFTQTILLVLEKYFHNPQYEKIEDYQIEDSYLYSSSSEN